GDRSQLRHDSARNGADDLVVVIGDQEPAVGSDRDELGAFELGGGGGAAVAHVAGRSGAGDGGDRPGSRDLADPVVVVVGDQVAPVGGGRDPLGEIQLGRAGRAAVTAGGRW